MCVCVFVCVCLYVGICMYICLSVCMYVCVDHYMDVSTYVCMCLSLHGYIDVRQNVAQERTLYYSGPIYIGDPLNAYWAKAASLGPDTFVRKSPWDQKYL